MFVFHVEEGLGNACAVLLPDDSCGVVDWGTQDPDAFERLFALIGPRRLAFIAATHAHQDHTLGLPGLLDHCDRKRVVVDRFVYPASSLYKKNAYLTRARCKARDLGIRTSAVTVDDFAGPEPLRPPWLAFGRGWEVRVLSPAASQVSRAEIGGFHADVVPGNETSLVITCRFLDWEASALLPGDATRGTLNFARAVASTAGISLVNQCLVVPHHGARNGVPEWLFEASSGALIISAPTSSDNHPSRDLLVASALRCQGTGQDVYCTSYSHACRTEFRQHAELHHEHLVAEGKCFGDMAATIGINAAWTVESSHDGHRRRRYGFCRSHTGDGSGVSC